MQKKDVIVHLGTKIVANIFFLLFMKPTYLPQSNMPQRQT